MGLFLRLLEPFLRVLAWERRATRSPISLADTSDSSLLLKSTATCSELLCWQGQLARSSWASVSIELAPIPCLYWAFCSQQYSPYCSSASLGHIGTSMSRPACRPSNYIS